jgi:hypothetical protein
MKDATVRRLNALEQLFGDPTDDFAVDQLADLGEQPVEFPEFPEAAAPLRHEAA